MKLPIVHGKRVVRAFVRLGWQKVSQRGSHVKMVHSQKENPIIIPLHREIDRGTLSGILKDADVTVEEFIDVLR